MKSVTHLTLNKTSIQINKQALKKFQ